MVTYFQVYQSRGFIRTKVSWREGRGCLVKTLQSCLCVRNGQRRVDPLAAIFNRQNQTGKVSRQKQEYQRQGRDVNNTRQKSGAQVQRSKVRQSGVKHRDSRMNRRTLRNVTRGKQDFALGECLCAAFMWVREWGAGVVRQSELMSEWWQLCDWCNGGRECVSAVHDGKCSPWVMCSLSEWEPDSWHYDWNRDLNELHRYDSLDLFVLLCAWFNL